MNMPDGGIGGSRTGIGTNFAKARLLLAKRAGYLPEGTQLDPQNAPDQWAAMSKNLAADARKAGFQNPMQFLRQGATQGGTARPARVRPGNMQPGNSLPYYNSQLMAALGRSPQPQPQMQPGMTLPMATPIQMLPQIHRPQMPALPQQGMMMPGRVI